MNDCKDCEQYCSDNTCCTCRNRESYRLYEDYKRKEQECEELKKVINEAKNSKLDLKSFLVGEAIQNEYEQQLDQLKQTLTEIKEIAGYEFKELMNAEDYHNMTEVLQQILQKISECEVER